MKILLGKKISLVSNNGDKLVELLVNCSRTKFRSRGVVVEEDGPGAEEKGGGSGKDG